MSTSKLKLYTTNITPAKNTRVDDIDTYLSSCDNPYSSDKFQYQRIALTMSIKVNMLQNEATVPNVNYARIEQEDKVFYFFIMSAKQLSRKTVQFNLAMDTINTYWFNVDWSAQTSIIREHVNRWMKSSTAAVYQRAIDKYQEGLNPVKDSFTRTRLKTQNSSMYDKPAYLIWMKSSEETPEKQSNIPVVLGTCFDNDITIKSGSEWKDTEKTLASVFNGKEGIYYLTSQNIGASASIVNNLSSVAKLNIQMLDKTTDDEYLRCVRIVVAKESNNKYLVTFRAYYYTGNIYPYSFSKSVDYEGLYYTDGINFVGNINYLTHPSSTSQYYMDLTDLNIIDSIYSHTAVQIGTIPAQVCAAFSKLDRASNRILKIVKVPAAPFSADTANLQLISGFNIIKVDTQNSLKYAFPWSDDPTGKHIADIAYQPFSNLEAKAPYNINNESKLYSSEFYDYKLTYHDYTYPFALEYLKKGFNKNITFTPFIQFSAAMSGDMLLQFNTYSDYFDKRYPNEEYFFFTGTEVPQYSSEWINYLRNGYNYDSTQRKIANRNSLISGSISALSAMVPLISPVANIGRAFTGVYDAYKSWSKNPEPALKDSLWYDAMVREGNRIPNTGAEEYNRVDTNPAERFNLASAAWRSASTVTPESGSIGKLVLQQGINGAQSAYTAYSSISANNRSFQQQVNKAQTASVNPTSTVSYDLTPDDNIWLVQAQPREEVRAQIAKIFYYTGYSHPVQEIPDFTSRYWFNYVQCNPVFLNQMDVLHPEYENDFKQRFQAGVTVMHAHNGEYDWEQQYENWETFLPISNN